jgi:hypothetical protein
MKAKVCQLIDGVCALAGRRVIEVAIEMDNSATIKIAIVLFFCFCIYFLSFKIISALRKSTKISSSLDAY